MHYYKPIYALHYENKKQVFYEIKDINGEIILHEESIVSEELLGFLKRNDKRTALYQLNIIEFEKYCFKRAPGAILHGTLLKTFHVNLKMLL